MANREAREWELIYNEWNPDDQPLREALCALGNGYFVTRGAFEEVEAGEAHYPGTYLAGGYNRLETKIAGRVIENEDLVNWPNWLPLTFRPVGGEWLDLDAVELLDFSYRLDVYHGLLERFVRFRDTADREFSLTSRRLVHMDNPHLAGIEWRLKSHNWSGDIEIRSALDGRVRNENVERYQDLNNEHLEVLEAGLEGEDAIFLSVRTNQSHIRMAQAARTRVFEEGEITPAQREHEDGNGQVAHRLIVPCHQQKELRVEKIVALHTARDFAISEPTLAARKSVRRAGSFAELQASHERKWEQYWSYSDIKLGESDVETQLLLRLHIFHLLQTTSVNTIGRDVGVPARGWHGEAYRGHVFWDELFIFPFLKLRLPELARSLLMYRYHRLDEARHMAREEGYEGAMYPWQSSSDGREETQVVHLNPESGRWLPDETQLQRHVNSAIAYNVWQYYEVTGDMEFLAHYGAEMLLEIARFWASASTYNADRERYEIRGVVGPDEFQTHYPGLDEPGLRNNAYTNVMAVWVLRTAANVLSFLDEKRRRDLRENLALDDEELMRWEKISRNMFVPFHDGSGSRDQSPGQAQSTAGDLISQFEGYGELAEFDWEGYKEKYDDIHRLDRILEAEGDDVNRYKASKQADALMLFYLFSAEELADLFEHMGYPFDPETIPATIDYYMERTSHGSTLSGIVHSWVLARADREGASKFFQEALRSDIDDVQGGTTPEGIHLGAMSGTVDLIQRVQTGLEMHDEVLWFNPQLPYDLSDVRLRLRYRGHWLSVRVTDEELTISFDRGGSGPARICVAGEICEMKQGETRTFSLT